MIGKRKVIEIYEAYANDHIEIVASFNQKKARKVFGSDDKATEFHQYVKEVFQEYRVPEAMEKIGAKMATINGKYIYDVMRSGTAAVPDEK